MEKVITTTNYEDHLIQAMQILHNANEQLNKFLTDLEKLKTSEKKIKNTKITEFETIISQVIHVGYSLRKAHTYIEPRSGLNYAYELAKTDERQCFIYGTVSDEYMNAWVKLQQKKQRKNRD